MEKHFLNEFVKGEERLSPEPWYNPDGDCVVYQMVNEAIVADRIDEILTIYRSAITERPIGYEIKGVGALMNIFGWDAIKVLHTEDGKELSEVSVSILLLVAYERGAKTIGRRKAYADAMESFSSSPRLKLNDLPGVPV